MTPPPTRGVVLQRLPSATSDSYPFGVTTFNSGSSLSPLSKNLGTDTSRLERRCLEAAGVRDGVRRFLDTRPFAQEIDHFSRHGDAEAFRHVLWLAAQPGATEAALLAGLRSGGRSRRAAGRVLSLAGKARAQRSQGAVRPSIRSSTHRTHFSSPRSPA